MTPRKSPGGSDSLDRDAAIRRLFESAREGIYIGWLEAADGAAGTTLAVNPCLKQILGYPADADEQSILLFAPAHYVDLSARARLCDVLIGQGGVNDYLVQLRRVDGSHVWVEITAHTNASADRRVRVDALVSDVDARRQLDERARTLYQQLAHSEQMAAIARTLADVAHELGNPLATIVAWAERLSQHALDDKARKGVSEIVSASERASRIVRNALHSSSRQPSTRSMVDVNAIVEETLALRQHDQRAINVTVSTALGPEVPLVLADAHQLQQVLLNLIINAEHAMSVAHNRGTLSVRTTADARRHLVLIEVSDDGPGVPEALRSRIFDPFFTTKQARAGTGLGLAVAQALAHEHGGSIRLAHGGTEGATFVLELPTRTPAPATS
jgi:PAS domain S-box-containing protein